METFALAFSTFFVTIGPVDVGAVFAVLVANTQKTLRTIWVSVGIATGILLTFVFIGDVLFRYLGVSVPALRISGGILLLLSSIDLLFNAHSDTTGVSKKDTAEARTKDDIAVFPLAMPLLAGPASITSVIVLIAQAEGSRIAEVQVVAAMLLVMLLAMFCMLLSRQIIRLLGRTGMNVISRLTGLLLATLATQFILDGIRSANLFG